MVNSLKRRNSSSFAAIVWLTGLIGASAVAPGCDDIAAQSFGGNALGTGSGGQATGGLARGHGGTSAILIATGGAGGRGTAAGGAGGTPPATPASTGGTGSAAPGSGTGGIVSTGGVTGSGGTASGGSTGTPVATGGLSGSGGETVVVTGTGGVTSTGGVSGTGGVTGTGGTSAGQSAGGAAGRAGPGSGAAGAPAQTGMGGGTSKDQPPDACSKLVADYDDAVAAAKACDAGPKAASACAKSVPASLSGCGAGCITFVDDDSKPKMLQQQWAKAGCKADSCATVLCISPTAASCVASSGNKGTCTDSLLGI